VDSVSRTPSVVDPSGSGLGRCRCIRHTDRIGGSPLVSDAVKSNEPANGSSGSDIDREFEQFFVVHHDSVQRWLAARIGDREVAVDATQDAFIKAHARWPTIRTYNAPDAWVRRIALNVSRDRMKSDRRRRTREATIEGRRPDAGVLDLGSDDLLAQLPPRQQQVAAMFYVEDLGVDEIANRLGISSGTVKSQLSEARSRLRRSDPD